MPANTIVAGPNEIRDSVAHANIPTLLPVLVQLTGDRRWLRDPYRVRPIRGVGDNDTGGLPPERQAEIRSAATAAILNWIDGAPIALPTPTDELVVEMLSAAIGEPIAPEYGPMISADLTAADQPVTHPAIDTRSGLDVVVIGSGVSGICAGVRLREAGIAFTIIERNDTVGGTWLENRYPGAAVDTPSHLYSFSFAPHDWPRYFATRDQVANYLQDVTTTHALWPHIRLQTTAINATYNSGSQRWAVTVRNVDGSTETVSARVLISAVGAFNSPKIPDIPGRDTFEGPVFHTARWPSDVDLAGKAVALVGNGASAMQVAPAIAAQVGSLTIFQRSSHWVAPFEKFQEDVPHNLRRLLDVVPLYRIWYRIRLCWLFNDKLHAQLTKDPNWPHPDRALNASNDRLRHLLTRYISTELGDRQDLLAAVIPTYPPLGKRLLLDNGWYRTLCNDNVGLVTDPIERIEKDRLVCRGGRDHAADVLIFATGFDVVRFLSTLDVRGRTGELLRDVWDDDNGRAYLGSAVPGFPNMFILYGPNTQTGHGGSLIGLVEAQLNHIMPILRRMAAEQIAAVEISQLIYDTYNKSVDDAHNKMIWTHKGMETYTRNSRGRVVGNTPYRVVDFWRMTRDSGLEDYVLIPDGGSDESAAPMIGRRPTES